MVRVREVKPSIDPAIRRRFRRHEPVHLFDGPLPEVVGVSLPQVVCAFHVPRNPAHLEVLSFHQAAALGQPDARYALDGVNGGPSADQTPAFPSAELPVAYFLAAAVGHKTPLDEQCRRRPEWSAWPRSMIDMVRGRRQRGAMGQDWAGRVPAL